MFACLDFFLLFVCVCVCLQLTTATNNNSSSDNDESSKIAEKKRREIPTLQGKTKIICISPGCWHVIAAMLLAILLPPASCNPAASLCCKQHCYLHNSAPAPHCNAHVLAFHLVALPGALLYALPLRFSTGLKNICQAADAACLCQVSSTGRRERKRHRHLCRCLTNTRRARDDYIAV